MNNLPSLRSIWWTCGFVAAYTAFDMLSGPEARYQAITPVWHPAAGLGLFLLLHRGFRGFPPLVLAALLAAWITPALPSQPARSLVIGLLPLTSYVAIAWFMRKYLPGGAFFASHRGVLIWAAAVTAGSGISGALYVSMLSGRWVPDALSWMDALIRFTIAETAGMLVTMPLAYCLTSQDWRADFLSRIFKWETVAYTVLIALVLAIALQRPTGEWLTYFLLFLPLVWAAARQGMAGAVTAAVVLEASVTAAALSPGPYAAQMPDVQMLVLTLTLSGFLIGIAVDVARRASNELRQSLRLAAAGEMAAALAHELNQPLTALSAYGSACERLLARDGGDPLLQKTIHAMVAESQRASNVLKRLREFFRTGSTILERLPLPDLIQAATRPFMQQAHDEGIQLTIGDVPEVTLLGDRVQLEIVLRNLLANAFQALTEQPMDRQPRVTVDAGVDGKWIWIRIADNGPGIANKIRARLFEPFVSLKSSGLGLGLAISRSIVETHGGSLTVEPSPYGILRITLPAETSDKEVLSVGK
jgi:signal transduction histidine kinase